MFTGGLAWDGRGMHRVMAVAAGLSATMLALTSAAVTAAPAQVVHRGTLISAELVSGMDSSQVAGYLAESQLDSSGVRNGVDAYRFRYHTIGANGRPTTASGLAVLPRTGAKNLRVVAWLHGTLSFRGYAPSVADSPDRAMSILFAAAGYLAVAPDYLGLGQGPGTHPYMIAKPAVTASVDALRAARELAAQQGKQPDERILVSGFSQGGQIAMILGQALQDGADRHLRLGALAPVSGPYDMWGAQVPAALSGAVDPVNSAYYLGYFAVAWDRAYNIYDSPGDAFQDPATAALFDNNHREEDIFAALPGSPQEELTPPFLAHLRHPTGTLRRAQAANDIACRGWRPRVPVRLYASTGDRDVTITNSEHCQRFLAEHGVWAPIVELGGVDHFTSVKVALPQIRQWFDRL